MKLFRLEKPRGFRHHYLYYNERKALLQKLEQEILQTADAPSHEEQSKTQQHRSIQFGNRSSHKVARSFFANSVSAGVLLALLFVLCYVLFTFM